MKSFASDNYSGIHQDILKAINKANSGHSEGYGEDKYTKRAINKFKIIFGQDIDVYFVLNGTGANILSLCSQTKSFNSVICAETAHINRDESCAPETLGCKLTTINHKYGKIHKEDIKPYLNDLGNKHRAQPKIISITQPTEMGVLYTIDEIKDLAGFAHENDMLLHMDGARIANACVALNKNFKEMTKDAGVDILSFGGTKNGMMIGEGVIFFDKEFSKDFKYFRKNYMQLLSKMRFISAQFDAYLTNNLWKKNAENSNKMCQFLYEQIKDVKDFEITTPVDTNSIFLKIPKEITKPLQEKYPFYVWNNDTNEVRWMCSFDTTEEDILDFVNLIKKELGISDVNEEGELAYGTYS